ncbi:MAG TPA: endonuclease domain-containing protein [Candidatus Corynebacterium avicola]|uniref:Endonuclease domain-containing protein n=1 Tax=Candidatus Corynebacterium avicola TaxID=2838527 RepID=A0A9D1UK22_9CORY|nr:endonuclease domain-containing protein [Candidatus Corynebacterium avicola]
MGDDMTDVPLSGRGPDYTRRSVPLIRPRLREELRASGTVTDWQLRNQYVQAAPGVVVPVSESGHDPTAFGGFGHDILTRSVAHNLIRPDAVLGGWGAARMYGLRPDWGDSAPVLLLTGAARSGNEKTASAVRTPLRPVIRPLPDNPWVGCVDRRYPHLQVVSPQLAAVQCLRTVLTSGHEWWVHDVPGLTREEVRAVQLMDAMAQCTWVTRAGMSKAAKGRVNERTMRRLLKLTDDGAQSPMETVMRLILRDVLPAPYRWTSQIRVDLESGSSHGWTPRTLPDLGCRELKLALYYDGEHHRDPGQTDVDFNQFHALRDIGWESLRFNKHNLKEPERMRESVRKVLARILA